MDARCNPEAIRTMNAQLKTSRDALAEELEKLKRTYSQLDWEDRMAVVTEQILNRHILSMNTELNRLGCMIHTLETLQEAADYYTSSRATDVTV